MSVDGREHVLAPIVAANLSVDRLPQVEVPDPGSRRLSDLKMGQSATVLSILPACRGAQRRRLLEKEQLLEHCNGQNQAKPEAEGSGEQQKWQNIAGQGQASIGRAFCPRGMRLATTALAMKEPACRDSAHCKGQAENRTGHKHAPDERQYDQDRDVVRPAQYLNRDDAVVWQSA